MQKLVTRSLSFLALALVASCGEPEASLKAKSEGPPPFETMDISALKPFSDPVLARGLEIYQDSCARCHRIGKAGAPRIGHAQDWTSRIEAGMDQLFSRALNGYDSPTGNEMPARGGNDALTDADVKAAVQLMVHLSATTPNKP